MGRGEFGGRVLSAGRRVVLPVYPDFTGLDQRVGLPLLLSRDLGFLSESEHGELSRLLNETKRMLISLIQKLRNE